MSKTGSITALILAGGAGRRVGGRDKGLLDHHGQPLVAHAITQLTGAVDRILISCNRNRDQYGRLAELAPADSRPGFAGPLAGLEAVAHVVTSDYLLVVPCDNPALPRDLVERLLAPLTPAHSTVDACWANDGARDQYLYCALRRSCLASLGPFLDSGERAVRHWLARLQGEAVDFSDQAGCFQNLNTLPGENG